MEASGTNLAGVGDEALLLRLQQGDDDAFELLVRRYGTRMMAVARRILGNDSDAQDAVQEAFLSAFRSIDKFDGRSQLGTWLHRITVNACLMRLRKQQRRNEQDIERLLPSFEPNGHLADRQTDWSEPALAQVERQETRDLVRQAIDQLPEDYRTVLLLRDIEELNTAETAAALGVSNALVKTRLHRARQALRGILGEHFQGGAA